MDGMIADLHVQLFVRLGHGREASLGAGTIGKPLLGVQNVSIRVLGFEAL